MSVFARSRANSEFSTGTASYQGNWISEIFQRYHIPPSLLPGANQLLDGQPKAEFRFLGMAHIEKDNHYLSQAAFYEISESQLVDLARKSIHEGWDAMMTKQVHESATETTTAGASVPTSRISETASISSFFDCINAGPGLLAPSTVPEKATSIILPPKKRRRHRIVHSSVVFCLTCQHKDIVHLSPEIDYFLFPHDAVVEAMNESPPLDKIVFSFHPPDNGVSLPTSPRAVVDEGNRGYSTKLEEFAAVCTSGYPMTPRRRSTDPGIHMFRDGADDNRHQAVNMCISGASQSLYLAIKQSVSGFEALCDKMMQLMRLHNQEVATQKARSGYPTEQIQRRQSAISPLSPTKAEQPHEWDNMYYDTPHQFKNALRSETCSSSDEATGDKELYESDKLQLDSVDAGYKTVSAKWTSPPPPATTTSSSKQHQAKNTNANGSVKKCFYCGSKSTPMWRRGPQGAGTLCNACGVKWKHGKILCEVRGDQTQPAKERHASSKGESKRRKNQTKPKKRKAKEETQTRSDDDMDDDVASRHLSIREDEDDGDYDMLSSIPIVNSPSNVFAAPAPRETFSVSRSEAHSYSSSSHSVSETHSPLGPSPSPSPPRYPLLGMQTDQRRTLDLPIVKQMGLSDVAFPLSAGVDAVEAAAVLTLLKRS